MAGTADLVETLVTTPLAALLAVDRGAGTARWERLRGEAKDFHRGALALHLHWAARDLGAGGPWVWANGDPHPGNFATLATGPRRGARPAAVYDLSDADDEHPAPWHWDLLRCLGGLGVWWRKGGQAALRRLAGDAIARYAEVMARAAEGDADHGGRIFLQDLPAQVADLLEHDGDPEAEARWQRKRIVGGKRPRLRRDDRLRDDPGATVVLEQVRRWIAQRGGGLEPLDAARRAPTGLSSLGRRRYLVLCREGKAFRILEVKERRPSELSRLLPAHPFDPRTAKPLALTVPLGRDPWQDVMPGEAWPFLVRTRCHARSVADPAEDSDDDRRSLVKLWATLLANAHLRGLASLGVEVEHTAAAIAADARKRRADLARLCAAMPERNRAAWQAFRRDAATLAR
ncbi:MAG: DUF2252 family protein [Paludibaculum sp.]